MKLITKPIRKGTNEIKSSFKASALATAVLAGTIALTASGCTAEIKNASIYFLKHRAQHKEQKKN